MRWWPMVASVLRLATSPGGHTPAMTTAFDPGGPVAEGQKKAVRGKCRFCTATVSSLLVQEVPLICGSLRLSWAIKKGVRKEGRLSLQNQCLFSRNSSITKELRYCWRTF